MKSTIIASIAALAMLSGCGSSNGDGGWSDLFNKDLSNAEYEQGVWSRNADGDLQANKDSIIFSKADYENFEVELEFKMEPNANSGIVVYCTDTKNWIPNSIEIQISDSDADAYKNRPAWQCGAVFGHVAPKFPTGGLTGQWHKMLVRCKGQLIDTYLDSKHVSSMDMSKWTDNKKGPDGTVIPEWLTKQKKCEMATKGKVGLQGKHGKAACDFRNVKIRPIK